jgi:hypothetical protein
MLGIGRTKLYELIGTGEIEIIKIGKSTLVPIRSLEALVERKRLAQTAAAPEPRRRGRPPVSFVRLASRNNV